MPLIHAYCLTALVLIPAFLLFLNQRNRRRAAAARLERRLAWPVSRNHGAR